MAEKRKIDAVNKNWATYALENDAVKITLIPDLGGKIIEIINKKTGTQFLKNPSNELQHIKPPKLGFLFEPPYAFGFDECFPTVAPSKILFNESVIQLPDHGELWTQPWSLKKEDHDHRIILTAVGVNLSYQFQKKISLNRNEIRISYRLKNTTYKDFEYLWSAHPLLEVEIGDEILLPKEIQKVQLYYSAEDDKNEERSRNWPYLNEEDTDFSIVQEKGNTAMKLFAEHIKTGRAGLYKKKKNESILFDFDTDEIPHLGLWLCYGGWPQDSNEGDFTVAIEPTTAAADKLSEAKLKEQHRRITPGEVHEWSLKLSITKGKKSI